MLPRHADEPFDPVLNVRRDVLMNDMLEWVELSSPSFRLRSVVGSAGSGKSWFMADLYRELQRKNPSIIVVWMNFSARPVHPVRQEPEPVLHGLPGWQNWMAQISGQTLPSQADVGAKLSEFLKHQGNIYEKIIVLADGFDEIPSQDRRWVEEHVLAVAFADEKVRLIMTRRDQDALNHPILRWNDEVYKLPGLTPDERQEQIKRRHQSLPLSISIVTGSLEHFLGENPYANTRLFDRFRGRQGQILTVDDLKECARDISRRAGLLDGAFDLLEKLARYLPRIWTVTHLSNELDMRVDDLEPLFEAGLICQATGKAQYETDSGIYALYHSMRSADGFGNLSRENGTV